MIQGKRRTRPEILFSDKLRIIELFWVFIWIFRITRGTREGGGLIRVNIPIYDSPITYTCLVILVQNFKRQKLSVFQLCGRQKGLHLVKRSSSLEFGICFVFILMKM